MDAALDLTALCARTPSTLHPFLVQGLQALTRANAIAVSYAATDPHLKPDGSPVTQADLNVERSLRQNLHSTGASVIGEEQNPEHRDSRFTWIIDPIDGTRAFILGSPLYAILLGLLEQDHPVLGFASFPALGKLYLGIEHVGAFEVATCSTDAVDAYRFQSIRVHPKTRLEDAICAAQGAHTLTQPIQTAMAQIWHAANIVASCDDAYPYAMLASGRIHIRLESGLQPYDVLPLVPIITAAGGCISQWNGDPLTAVPNQNVVATSSPELHQQVVDKLFSAYVQSQLS